MTLYEKLKSMYPTLTINDFTTDGTILINTDEEGNEVIVSWAHPTITQPTQDMIDKF